MNVNPALAPTIALGGLLFLGGMATARRWQRAAVIAGTVFAVPCILAVLYYTHLFDGWAWFYEARSIRYSELTFAGVAFLGGALFGRDREDWKERWIVPLITGVLVVVPFVKPILSPLDMTALRDQCKGSVCLQSTLSTCGPASAASLLRGFGDTVTEKDLATESFSYRGGTEVWYLARALQRRGYDTEFVFSAEATPYPAIAGVKLPGGAGHFIAVVEITGSTVTVVDPMSGQSVLTLPELRRKYQLTDFYLKIQRRL